MSFVASRGLVAFVSGASSGLGLEIAALLAEAGLETYGGARSFPDGVATHERGFKTVKLDVTSSESVERAVKAVESSSGKAISLLVNNAGRGLAGAVEDTSLDEVKNLFEANFFGALRVLKAALPKMRESGSGLVVNIGSLSAQIPLPFQGLYSASKAATAALSDSLASELAPFGIEVVLIEPGDFSSGFTDKRPLAANVSTSYKEATSRYVEGAARREREGRPAKEVARKIVAVATSRRRRFRYMAASPSEKLGVISKQIVLKKAFDKILEIHYLR